MEILRLAIPGKRTDLVDLQDLFDKIFFAGGMHSRRFIVSVALKCAVNYRAGIKRCMRMAKNSGGLYEMN